MEREIQENLQSSPDHFSIRHMLIAENENESLNEDNRQLSGGITLGSETILFYIQIFTWFI